MDQVLQGEKQFFSLRYSAAIRVWHWLTFLFILGSLVTVLFAETLFEEEERDGLPPSENQHQVQREGAKRFDPTTLDPATRAAFEYRDKIWGAHNWIGFGL